MTMKNESGRSMVEMLGVLAIIGVLSIGGIAGYTMAMNRYRANEIIDTASKVAIVAMTANAGAGIKTGETIDLGDLDANMTIPCITGESGIQAENAGGGKGIVTITLDPACTGVAEIIGTLAKSRLESNGCAVDGACQLDFGEYTAE